MKEPIKFKEVDKIRASMALYDPRIYFMKHDMPSEQGQEGENTKDFIYFSFKPFKEAQDLRFQPFLCDIELRLSLKSAKDFIENIQRRIKMIEEQNGNLPELRNP